MRNNITDSLDKDLGGTIVGFGVSGSTAKIISPPESDSKLGGSITLKPPSASARRAKFAMRAASGTNN